MDITQMEIKTQLEEIIKDAIESNLKRLQPRKQWLTLKEAAAYLGVAQNSLSKLRRRGLVVAEIEGIKRVSITELDRFMEENSY